MNITKSKVLVSALLASIFFGGCIASASNMPNQSLSNSSKKPIFSSNITDNFLNMTNETPPDIKKLSSFVSNDKEEQYFYNLLSDYVHNISNIAVVKETKKFSNNDLQSGLKKELHSRFPTMSDAQLDSIVAQQTKGTSKGSVEQVVLKEIPVGASHTLYEVNKSKPIKNTVTINNGTTVENETTIKNMITIYYSLNSHKEAQAKLASLTSKLKSFLSHDKNWSITDAEYMKQLKKEVITDDRKSQFKADMEKRIKAAESRGEDTTNMRKGLAKFDNDPKDELNNSSFAYAWNVDLKVVHNINVSLNVDGNKLKVMLATRQMSMPKL